MKTEKSKLEAQQDQLNIPVALGSDTSDYLHFSVVGAGKIQISEDCQYLSGGEEGFSFGVEWGAHGFAGGVLSKEESKKLAEHILNALK